MSLEERVVPLKGLGKADEDSEPEPHEMTAQQLERAAQRAMESLGKSGVFD